MALKIARIPPSEAEDAIDDVLHLPIEVFREFPNLNDGDMES